MKKLIQLTLTLSFILFLVSCKNTNDEIILLPESSSNSINKFSLKKEDNPSLSEDVILEINGNEIFGRVPYHTNISSLVCDFNTSGKHVEVNGVSQTSRISENNFREPVAYNVYAENGEINTYYVTIQYFTGLPTISIDTENGQNITSRDVYLNGTISIFGTNAKQDLVSDFKIRGRGNSTWNPYKKPYQIKFEDKESILGMAPDRKWILLANYSDKTLIRNEVAFVLGRISNLDWTPDSRFVELFINSNYRGTYQITQKVEETSNRVKLGDNGFLLEVNQLERLEEDDVYFTTDRHLFDVKEPNIQFNDPEYFFIKNYITEFENTLFSDNFKDPINGYRKYIEVESFVDWFIINELTRNVDAKFHTSVYMNLIPNEKLKMGPIWDFDIGLGNINYGGNENPIGFHIKNALWMERLFQDEYFVDIVKERFESFTQKKNLVFETILSNSKKLNDAQTENFKRWDILGLYVWPNYVFLDTYDEEVNYLYDWLETRWAWMDDAISDL